jgi:hypothetical protein
MLGMDHSQRSNAVGSNTAYLPSGDTGRQGGGTYTGQATEPTLQDYENFFGPSARDIKTDLQRFKRHGRWHLPDVLQGPNPWLTDRIDGLITDATNSPFTTKILPYRYKEDVDGKIKWNVWSFDEGMASRVPYESAARTLTQSKRSFAGYMVRQGMAIVLEHNFMMTPKGRENFKNQLNQLIGSIQYTNDLDVHMALILAPSYQKTMAERYYTSDKSPSQLCREYADLFGMMQKNVNALDILIEEGKAILRTWGGPMPDFLLCNSKLTFQMTMTPEKTNYITQGIDGVKRLRQGPDLGSYRGLNVIHTRSFSMEVGQQPRDVLRRRVRTAEYYRILPSKKNVNREFEFYNEERDTWFTLSFHDLLRCARYMHEGGGPDNAAKIDVVYHGLAGHEDKSGPRAVQLSSKQLGAMLGAYARTDFDSNTFGIFFGNLVTRGLGALADQPLSLKFEYDTCEIRPGSKYGWFFRAFTQNFLGVKYVEPVDNWAWDEFKPVRARYPPAGVVALPKECADQALGLYPLKPEMVAQIYSATRRLALNNPFSPGTVANPGSPEWFAAFTFYLELIKRSGLAFDVLDVARFGNNGPDVTTLRDELMSIPVSANPRTGQDVDITCQFLSQLGATGSVNHALHLFPSADVAGLGGAVQQDYERAMNTSLGTRMAYRLILTYEVLQPLLSEYSLNGKTKTLLDHLYEISQIPGNAFDRTGILRAVETRYNNHLEYSVNLTDNLRLLLQQFINQGQVRLVSPADGSTFSRLGVTTVPMYLASTSHLFHPRAFGNSDAAKAVSRELYNLSLATEGHLNVTILEKLQTVSRNPVLDTNTAVHPWLQRFEAVTDRRDSFTFDMRDFFLVIKNRINKEPIVLNGLVAAFEPPAGGPLGGACMLGSLNFEAPVFEGYDADRQGAAAGTRVVSRMTAERVNLTIDLNQYFDDEPPAPQEPAPAHKEDLLKASDVEIVVIRPNIEHNMLGVIMGLGGDDLGNTLWGQTELSVYDDSMHGIWGMSYKYHERAIVFNEKNLIRMWDIAYDGYNGGKDDTYVDWTAEESAPNGPGTFKEETINLGKNYRGPSMMVMAFAHDKSRRDEQRGTNLFDEHFKRNWPSPIVFYDSHDPSRGEQQGRNEALPLDYDNLQNVNVDGFRVFNNGLYAGAYAQYRSMMPDFRTLHVTRKTAGQGSADSETSTDCLAFQGSMKVKENGMLIQEIHGSGHHGPDYTGVASVRAGKGQKTAGQAPTLHRLI